MSPRPQTTDDLRSPGIMDLPSPQTPADSDPLSQTLIEMNPNPRPKSDAPKPNTAKPTVKTDAKPLFFSFGVFSTPRRVALLWLVLRVAALVLTSVSVVMRASSQHFKGLLAADSCTSQLSSGHWTPLSIQWQPATCAAAKLNPISALKCLKAKGNNRIVMFGDSSMRAFYYALRKTLGSKDPEESKAHTDLVSHLDGLDILFYWDPFLNRTDVMDAVFQNHTAKTVLTVVSAGAWFLRYGAQEGKNVEQFAQSMTHIKEKVEEGLHNSKFASDNFIVRLIPPFQEHLLSEERRNTLKNSARHNYNSKLFSLVPHDLPPPLLQLNKIGLHMLTEAPDSFSLDGLHFIPKVDRAEVDVLLNQLCNPILFAGKKMQGKTSCCVNYPGIPLSVWFIILLTIVFGHGAFYLRTSNPAYEPPSPLTLLYPTSKTAYAISILGLTLTACIITDRTQLFVKINKDFSVVDFVVMNLVWVIPGIWSMRVGSDSTFLNREQTDDWKGWMQFAILVYHYTGGSKVIPIYSVIRVMVASYLFMTGFGHFSFFYKKADFSFIRLARVLVRLNLLSIALSYTMETDTLFYYFGPLVSFWFLIVWGTMRVFNFASAGQDSPTLLTACLAASGALAYAFTHSPALYEPFFALCETVFGVHWNAREATFRLALDQWAVHFGMLAAWLMAGLATAQKGAPAQHTWHAALCSGLVARWPYLKWVSVVASCGVLAVYATVLVFVPFGKEANNALHPYFSLLVLGAFVVLRNATPDWRRTTSAFWRWIGGFSLETFILQYHFWMGVDTYGLLDLFGPGVMGGSYSGGGAVLRWFGVAVSSILFLALSEFMSDASGPLVEAVVVGALGKNPSTSAVAARVTVWVVILVGWNFVAVVN